jgi:hypothetical protein
VGFHKLLPISSPGLLLIYMSAFLCFSLLSLEIDAGYYYLVLGHSFGYKNSFRKFYRSQGEKVLYLEKSESF